MTKRSLISAMLVCCGLGVALAQPTATPPAKPAQPTTPAPAAPAQPSDEHAGMQAAPLGPEHIELARSMVGDWTATVSFSMGPGTDPQVSTSKVKFEPIMGARFIRQVFGEAKDDFKGEGLLGFNSVSKKYEATWVDNMTTGIMVTQGTKNAKGEIESTGDVDNPESGAKETIRTVMRFDGRTKMTYEMWGKGPGGEFKMLEVVYTRPEPTGRPTTPATPVAPSMPSEPVKP